MSRIVQYVFFRWIATQDKRLREVLSGIAGVPCMFLTYNGLYVETPSEASKKAAQKAQDAASGVSEWELSTDAMKNLKALSKKHSPSIFRKRKAKGPNPLSCLKKKPKQSTEITKDTSEKPKRRRRKPKTN